MVGVDEKGELLLHGIQSNGHSVLAHVGHEGIGFILGHILPAEGVFLEVKDPKREKICLLIRCKSQLLCEVTKYAEVKMIHNLLVGNNVWDLLLDKKELRECLNIVKRGFIWVSTICGCQIEKMLVVDDLIGSIINVHYHVLELIK